jgi:hypothetical protein
MDVSLDVFAILGEDNFLWIGCARTDNEAVELMRMKGLTKAERFFIHSQKTGRRTFYCAGRESGTVRVEQSSDA